MASLRRLGVAALLAAALSAGACSDESETVTPTQPEPTPESVTVTFTGKLTPAGSQLHTVSVGVGIVTTTLSAVGPDSTMVLGFGVGTWDGTTCTVVMQNDNAVQGSYLIGTATATLSICVKAYDVGNVVDEATYEFSVVHY